MPVRCEFNESTFALLASMELLTQIDADDRDDLLALPLVPDLSDEADGGFDLKLDTRWALIYLQFKVPVWVHGPSGGQRGAWGRPYYRFAVKTDTTSNGQQQHNTLVDLANQRGPGAGFVYYCAPAFRANTDLMNHRTCGDVLENSVFPSPLALGKVPAGSAHCYTYVDSDTVIPHSDPMPEDVANFSRVLDTLVEDIGAREARPLGDFLESAASALRNVAEVEFRASDGPAEQVFTLSSSMGLQPILVGARGG